MKKYYLAYGSNLNVDQMRRRCPHANPVGFAVINDYELLFKGSKTGSYLTIEPKKGSTVPVGVWEVDVFDEKALDRYEGYPSFYYKKEMSVYLERYDTDEVKKVKAFVYIMHEDRPIGIPSKLYLSTCNAGYYDFDFDPDILNNALKESVRRYRKEKGRSDDTSRYYYPHR